MDVPPSELWLKLSESPRPSVVVDFPRCNEDGEPIGQLRIQVLQMEAHDEARLLARVWLKDVKKLSDEAIAGETVKEVFGDAVARQLLCRACVTVKHIPGSEDSPTGKKYGRIFPSPEAIGQKLTADEINVLFSSYLMAQHKFGPYERNIQTEEELNAWIKRLVEGASAFPLARCDLHHLLELIMSLARRSYTVGAILESQSSSLPPTLKSDLETSGIGISFFSKRHVSATVRGSIPDTKEGMWFDDPEDEDDEAELDQHTMKVIPDLEDLPHPGDTLDIKEAARLAKKFQGD